MIPAQGHPDGGEPATEPIPANLVALIPAQRCAPPDEDAPVTVPLQRVRPPNPVLVEELALPSTRRPALDRVTAVVLGAGLVAVLLVVTLLVF